MEVKEIKEKDLWEHFLFQCKQKTFLQSWQWGEFHQLMGNKYWRLGLFDGKELLATALVSKVEAKRGTFFLAQHAPIIKPEGYSQRKEILRFFLSELKKMGQKEKISFVRINPLWLKTQENEEIIKDLGLREAPMHASAYEATLKLDIRPHKEEILKNMRKTTRYLIRQLIKNPDVAVEKSQDISDLEKYQKLNIEVSKRQRFVPFSFNFIKREFEVLSKENQILLFLGKYKNEIVSGAMVVFWSKIAFYHQAASLGKYAKLSIPYLVLWESILEAKKRGCQIYDFWGYVDPQKYPSHPWAGPSLFKLGFGGKPYFYLKTQDFILSNKYWLTYIFEKIRRKKRGL